MSALSMGGFLSQKDEVTRLNKQIDMMADFYHDAYSVQIEKLTHKLNNALKSKSEYKRKSETAKPKTRKENVFSYLAKGCTDYNLIAKECFTTYGVIKNYASQFRKIKK